MGLLRITVKADSKSQSQTQSFRFIKDILTFGNGSSEPIDIPLPPLGLAPEHVKILRQGDRYIAINQSNDPFVTLNGLPFYKKALKAGDILQIREAEICIDGFDDIAEQAPQLPLQDIPIIKVSKEEESSQEPQNVIPTFEDISALEIESFLGDVQEEPELIFKPPTSVFTQRSKSSHSPKETFGRISLKDEPFHENEDELKMGNYTPRPPSQGKVKKGHWKIVLWGFVLLLCALGVVASEIHFRITAESIEEKMFAAEGVADIAMSLTYAQLHQVNPASQNWSDPEFLRNNLLAILSPTSLSSRSIISSSQSSTGPYILRIYTSYDLSRFLVVAQPTPNFKQLWVPKHAIIVDSKLMTLRETADFKALNRFLAYPNPLDESHMAELEQILANSNVIHLTDLSNSTGNLEFMPPKALGYLRPGAEDRIYNAPRYHEFGDAVLLHAMAHKDSLDNGEDGDTGNSELEKLAMFGNFVLYIPEKLTLSPNASNLFSSLPLEGKFLLGYLNLTSDGKIKSSHLMMQNDQVWNRDSDSGKEDVAIVSKTNDDAIQKTPLELDLIQVADKRKEVLNQIKDKITAALEKQIADNNPAAIQEVNELIKTYDLQAMQQNLMIKEALEYLRQKYTDVPIAEFDASVKSAGLGGFLDVGL